MAFALNKSLAHWQCHDFDDIFKAELQQLSVDQLIPQAVVAPGHIITDADIHTIILSKRETENALVIKVVFQYQAALLAYCCGDEEPTLNNACQIAEVVIDKGSAETKLQFFSDEEE